MFLSFGHRNVKVSMRLKKWEAEGADALG